MAGDPTHPTGVVVEIVGIDRGDRGRSCEEHDVCGSVVEEDTLLCLRKEQIMVDGVEETAISCYWVIKHHMIKDKTCALIRRGPRPGDEGVK